MTQPTTPQSGGAGPDPSQSAAGDPSGTGNPNPVDPTSGDPQGGDNPITPAAITPEAYAAIQARMQAADRRASALEAENKKFKDAQLNETQRLEQRATEAEARAKELEESLAQERLNNAFLADKTYKWHNPEVALKLADTDLITKDDSGKVTGMKAALDKLAKEHPYLLDTSGGADGPDTSKGGRTGVTPSVSAGGRGADRSALEDKFPALKGRVPVK